MFYYPLSYHPLFHVFRRHSTERSVGYLPVFITVGCGDQKTRNNGNMLSFAQQNFKYSLQTREKTSWKTLGGFATSCFSLGFFSRLSVNICQYRFADHSILPQYFKTIVRERQKMKLSRKWISYSKTFIFMENTELFLEAVRDLFTALLHLHAVWFIRNSL